MLIICNYSSKIFLLTVPNIASFVDHLCYFCLVFVMLLCMSVYLWEGADLLALICDV